MARQVQPLRITKPATPSSSPAKMPPTAAASRPLAEIGTTERRRNSPSYNQATRKMIVTQETAAHTDQSSPPSLLKGSPRDVWQGHEFMSPSRMDVENAGDRSPSLRSSSPCRRSSVERLAQVGRVKNSSIFALENKDTYDPGSLPVIERPSANRPMSSSVANSPFTRFDSVKKENVPYSPSQKTGLGSKDSDAGGLGISPSKLITDECLPSSSPRRRSPSPTKSALARTSMFDLPLASAFSPENGTWSDDEDRAATPRTLRRRPKSVTFHAAPEVNEYEQQTPEPSSSLSDREGDWDSDDLEDRDISYERGSSADIDRDDSSDADLENADKTPVVLPEDWSRMSPDEARTDLVDHEDDVFEGEPTARIASDGDVRPLPPLPSFMKKTHRQQDPLANAAELAGHGRRNLPVVPERAACSKEEILTMGSLSKMSLEDRLKFLSGSEVKSSSNESHHDEEELVITNLDTGESLRVAEAEANDDSILAGMADFASPAPHISRESILRQVRNSKYEFEDDSDNESSDFIDAPSAQPPVSELANLDPDVPIPSRESSSDYGSQQGGDAKNELVIKQEPADDQAFDMSLVRDAGIVFEHERESSVLHHEIPRDSESADERVSRESSMNPDGEGTMIHQEELAEDGKETLFDAMALLTVKDYSDKPINKASPKQGAGGFLGLPTFQTSEDWDFGMRDYITPSPPAAHRKQDQVKLDQTNVPTLQPPFEMSNASAVQQALDNKRSSFESLDSLNFQGDVLAELDRSGLLERTESHESPAVPERQATIKTGGKLKARMSGTQADLLAMAEQRRHASFEAEEPVPQIPEAFAADSEADSAAVSRETSSSSLISSEDGAGSVTGSDTKSDFKSRRKSRKSGGRMDLALDTSAFSLGDHDGLGLDEEFDRRIEAQKKGYLMRQSTKVIVASTRTISGESNGSSTTATTVSDAPPSSPTAQTKSTAGVAKSANSSPKKAEAFLKTEPWNGKVRHKSVRSSTAPRAAPRSEPAPPLPGQASALSAVSEGLGAGSMEEAAADGVERGRLFVKVVAVKKLDLPMPKDERIFFQLTLDNGLHCVTTADMELGYSAPIGQEFELVVLDDLEFQLTLSTKLPPRTPAATPTLSAPSPTKPKAQKQSGFSRLLSSPKKRAEKERLEREAMEAEEERLQEEARRSRSIQISAWDQLHELVNAQDGSFARAYINLKAHEKSCFGRQLVVDVPCYNEWALEQDSQVVNSVRSKRGTTSGPVRRPPYVVGQLQLQLLYVPKPKDATDADLPKSMSSAVREMSRAAETTEVMHEGHMSQEGGDCTHWRRRFFRLDGPRLTAYHEHTHQKRAVINLTKATRLVDDRTTLVADPAASAPASPSKSRHGTRGSSRRKSAFAEEDEGYQYVEEGFRIRFANGETIDFYADSREAKDEWMRALSQVIGRAEPGARPARWTDVVLARERATGAPTTANASVPAPAPATVTRAPPQQAPPAPPAASTAATEASSRTRAKSSLAPLTATAAPAKTSKSAPTSPVKGKRPASSNGATTATSPSKKGLALEARPPTPPLQARRGHRARDAVKSLIF